LLSGSGKFGTPWERMQWEWATGSFDAELLGDDDADRVDEATFATPGRPELLPALHAVPGRVRAAVAMMAAAARAVRGHARRGPRMARVLSFITPSLGVGSWLRTVVGAYRDQLLSDQGLLRSRWSAAPRPLRFSA
jgi:hypothetical protein